MTNTTSKDETSSKLVEFMERFGIVLYIWLLLVVVRFFQNKESLLNGELPGNDDHMRMVQIRDWLNGQSWFDLHQYRLNPSEPLLSHWSRVTDVIVGIPIWIMTPIFGQRTAELIAVIAIPSLLLLLFLFLIVSLTKKISPNKNAPLAAAFMAALSVATITQFELGRIDHHGLQIVMAVACCWYVIKSHEKIKYAAFAGVLSGLGLFVGIESAPYVGAACVAIVLTWVFGEEKNEQRLRWFGSSMAGTSVICLLLSAPPSQWFAAHCDALSSVYIQLTIAVALVLWALSFAGNIVRNFYLRFALAAVLGSVALILTVVLYPQCFAGPYSEVDARLVEIWLSNVSEAKPFHNLVIRFPIQGMAIAIMPIFTLLGFTIYHKTTKRGLDIAPRSILVFLILTVVAGAVQLRLMAFAGSFSIPFAAYLLIKSFDWSEKFKPERNKILVRLACVTFLAPITIPLMLGLIFTSDPMEKTGDKNETTCTISSVLLQLNDLPKGLALTQIDIGPAILYHTEHSVTSAPYHRNTAGNLAALDMFIEDENTAKQAVKRTGADYVIGCRNHNETDMQLSYAADGTLAKLLNGNTPNWLTPIHIDGAESLLIYRVIKD